MMAQKITPFIWFNTEALEAAEFYISVFGAGKIHQVNHYGEGTPAPPGSVLTVHFSLAEQEYIALNGGPRFPHSPAFSLVIACRDQDEINHFWHKLSEGGEEQACGWLKDRYGIHWQVVPENMGALMDGTDPTRAQRVMNAMFGMKKLDLPALQRAYAGEG
jgi:predicted 3-demethylubiquinone-9 3-methyltransferase (glyoxalase superfamily)